MSTLGWLDRAAAAWCEWVLQRGLDGLVALLLVLPIVLVARRSSPHFRSALLLIALLPLLAPVPRIALASRALPSVRGALAKQVERAQPATWLFAPAQAAPTSSTSPVIAADVATATAPAIGRKISWQPIVFSAWLAIVLGLLVRWIVHERRLQRVLRACRPLAPAELPLAPLEIARLGSVRVVESEAVAAPATTGWLRPTIVLPSRLRAALACDELRFVLLHELAHVRRGDLWSGALERLVRIAWFFHPAPWIVGRLQDGARESACDDAALSRFPRSGRRACAAAFLKVVELAGAARPRWAMAAALSRDGRSVRSRIMRMVEARRLVSSRLSRPAWFALAASGAALLFLLQPSRGIAQAAAVDADPKTRAAMHRAAEWLVHHQDPGGFWSASAFASRCQCEGAGGRLNDVGVTGLALLALTKEWEIDQDARLGPAIERADRFLASVQDSADGCIGARSGQHFMYGHAMAALALAELQVAAPSEKRAAVLRRAVDFVTRARNPYKGWRYSFPPDGDNDASVTSAMLLALGRAMESGLPVDVRSVDDGMKLLDELTDPVNGRTGYHEKGSLSAREPEDMDRWPADGSEAITAAALHARVAHDEAFNARPAMLRGAALLGAKLPNWNAAGGSIDFYYWFHGTEAMHSAGGAAWTRWREATVHALLGHQRQDGHAAGSFDPQVDPWGDNGGRVYSTAINLLTLAAANE